jgi:uncharacterized protein
MNKEYRVSCDLFTIPYKKNFSILYAPKIGYLCKANNDVINLLSNLNKIDSGHLNDKQSGVLKHLEENGVLNGSVEPDVRKARQNIFIPTRVTLFPTNQCNLRCIYCYASAGEHPPVTMKWNYVVAVIETIITNAKMVGDNSISIGFHGGGEPLLPWNFIKKVTSFAKQESRKNNLNLSIYSATNGLLSEKQLEWITEQFSDLNISFDGLPHVQDYHRPLPGGQGSFKFIDRTFKFLDSKGFNYGIRSTFSDYNIDLMEESYNFIIQHYHPKTIHFEPVFQCGRCKTNDRFNINLEKFAHYFKKIDERNIDKNIRFTYSGCRVETLTDSFCGVARDGFSITPDGYITACFETTSIEDPKSEYFFYGKIDENGKININEERRDYLHHLTVENLNYCKDCFAKWHCAGDCAAKLGHNNLHGNRGHERCLLNRQMVKDKLISILETHANNHVN